VPVVSSLFNHYKLAINDKRAMTQPRKLIFDVLFFTCCDSSPCPFDRPSGTGGTKDHPHL
jgi:hypothetical protein